jgi:hypothetical protein
MMALLVVGDSMRPVYRDGDIVYVRRDHDGVLPDYLGEECAVHTPSGGTFLKTLAPGTKPRPIYPALLQRRRHRECRGRMGIAGPVRAAAATALVFGGVTAHAKESSIATGNDLLRSCESSGGEGSYCLGYITGVYRGFTAGTAFANKTYICLPPDVEVGQGAMIVTKFLRENPVELHRPSELLIVLALTKAYPCPPK